MQITLIVDEKELDLIGAGLMELPFKHSAKLLQNITQQYITQRDTPIEIPTEEEKEEKE